MKKINLQSFLDRPVVLDQQLPELSPRARLLRTSMESRHPQKRQNTVSRESIRSRLEEIGSRIHTAFKETPPKAPQYPEIFLPPAVSNLPPFRAHTATQHSHPSSPFSRELTTKKGKMQQLFGRILLSHANETPLTALMKEKQKRNRSSENSPGAKD